MPPPTAAAPEATTAQLGDRTIRLPAPAGWIALDTGDERLRGELAAMVSRTDRLLVVFAPAEDAARIESVGSLTHGAIVTSKRSLEAQEIDEARFLELTSALRGRAKGGLIVDQRDAVGMVTEMPLGNGSGGEGAAVLVKLRVQSRVITLRLHRMPASAAEVAGLKALALAWKDAIRAANRQPAM